MFKKSLLFIVLLVTTSNINATTNIEKSWLDEKPRSITKDFYLWRYLNQDITPNDSIWALGQAQRVTNKLFYAYAKKLKHKGTNIVASCKKMSTNNIIYKSPDCIEIGLSIFDASKLNKRDLDYVIKRIKHKYPLKAEILEVLKSKNVFKTLSNSRDEIFFAIINNIGGKYRQKNFNKSLPIQALIKLQNNKKEFQTLIKLIVTNPKLPKLQKSLLNLYSKDLNHKTTFLLAMNAINHDKTDIALYYLKLAYENAYFKMDKDKVLFWQHRISQEAHYQTKLSTSWDINMYSLQAKEILNVKANNIYYMVPQNTHIKQNYDVKDAFSWVKALRKIKKVDENTLNYFKNQFTQENTTPHLTFFYERFYKYQNSYFINPYKDIMKNYAIKRQVTINSLARQESRFVPSSISTSYAMGVMQIMPFLSKALAKELKEPYDIYKQLEAPTNIRYAHQHLNYLERHMDNIVFIAYAYNGGIGFTRRMLKSGLFQSGKHEPYLSMELVHYDESRKYAKKVLANFIIYNNHLNKDNHLSINSYLKKIRSPFQTSND